MIAEPPPPGSVALAAMVCMFVQDIEHRSDDAADDVLAVLLATAWPSRMAQLQ